MRGGAKAKHTGEHAGAVFSGGVAVAAEVEAAEAQKSRTVEYIADTLGGKTGAIDVVCEDLLSGAVGSCEEAVQFLFEQECERMRTAFMVKNGQGGDGGGGGGAAAEEEEESDEFLDPLKKAYVSRLSRLLATTCYFLLSTH